jgi:hypothetical protein
MKIKIYSVDQSTGEETCTDECDLDEALERGTDEFEEALSDLQQTGRHWVGGGAAALSLLTLA